MERWAEGWQKTGNDGFHCGLFHDSKLPGSNMVAVELSTAYSAASLQKHSQKLHHFFKDKSLQKVETARSPDQIRPENGNVGLPRKVRNREVTSRYKAAVASTTQRRYPSPSLIRSPSPGLDRSSYAPESSVLKRSAQRRSISVERHGPLPSAGGAAKNTAETATFSSGIRPVSRALDGLWPSTNSVFSSMQLETSSATSATAAIDARWREHAQSSDHTLKPAANGVHLGTQQVRTQHRKGTIERNATPERRTPLCRQAENAKPSGSLNQRPDRDRWRRTGNEKVFGPCMSRSMDLSAQKESSVSSSCGIAKSKGAKSVPPPRSLSRSVNDGPATTVNRNVVRRISLSNQKPSDNDFACLPDKNSGIPASVEELEIANVLDNNIVSDTDSISSSGSAALSVGSGGGSRGPGRGTIVPARFWQDMAGKLGRFPDNGRTSSLITDQEGGKSTRRTKVTSSGLPLSSPSANGFTPSPISTGFSSPPGLSSPQPPSSPSTQTKLTQIASPSRCWASPTRTKALPLQLPQNLSLSSSRSNSVAGLLNLGIDARKGRKVVSQQDQSHDLRILHNRWLQWRFVNARAEVAMNVQTVSSENLLYNVWTQTSNLGESVANMQAELQHAKMALKLDSVLSSHAKHLGSWGPLDLEHSTALTGVMNALEAAIIRVPVIGGAKVAIQSLKEALTSAIDVMSTLESSMSKILPKVEVADSLLSELAKTVVQERAFLEECTDLLVATAALETEQRSLRAHLIQLEQEKNCNVTTFTNDFTRKFQTL